jgi:hypothetical protein
MVTRLLTEYYGDQEFNTAENKGKRKLRAVL